MSQDDFRDNYTGRCKQILHKTDDRAFAVINVEDQQSYDFYKNSKCLKGNIYASCCEYCGKDICLYYNPEVNFVPKGQGQIYFMSKEESDKYLAKKNEK